MTCSRPQPRLTCIATRLAFKPSILRGLATHAPYFHNGAAARIEDLDNFYDTLLTRA